MKQFKAKFITSASAILLCSALLGQEAYTIKNMSLKKALEKISKESNHSFIVDESLVDGKTAPNIDNVQGLKNALDKVLEGSGLGATIENNTIIIKEVSTYKIINGTYILDDVSVKSALGSTTEGTNSYTTGSMRTATKLDLSLRETPQSVSVITQQMIEDKKIDDFDTLMKNVTGVRVEKGVLDSRSSYSLRGFNLDYYQMDGIPMAKNDLAMYNYNMDKFDRVEIVKGANGLTSGAGNPGGAINMIRKHANSKVFKGDIEVSAGTWDTYKIKADISTPLNSDGSVRARLVASHKETDTFKDRVHNENDLVYAVIDADITDTTTISAGASYELEDLNGDSNNLPAFYSDGTKTKFDRSKNYSPDWSSWDTERYSYFVDFKQYLPNDILINAVYTHNDIKTKDRFNGYLTVWNGLNKDGSGLDYSWMYGPQDIDEDNVDIYSSIPFKLFNREHEIIAGFQYNKQNSKQTWKGDGDLSIDNLFTQNGSELAKPITSTSVPGFIGETKQTAFYINGKFEIVDDLKLILGGRLTSYDFEEISSRFNQRTKYDVKNEFTPFAGLVYDIDENHSAYVSYTDIFKPQNARDKDNKLLDPILGKNYEVGVKGEYFDKKLNTGITLFRIEQDNVAEDTGLINQAGNSIFEKKDGVTSKGVELEISGKLTDNWDLSAGYVYFSAEEANGNKFNTRAPRSNINIFTKYSMNDFSVGAGVNWKSDTYVGSGARKVSQDSYATVDLMASYDFSRNLTGQLNINNLFDKTYYSGYSVNAYAYGEPVNGMLSLKYKF
ncbi:TonB-dependent siderophore receptor [Aliarcobacter vitoriensis]|uniref:TonB-dependent siderophore receptor n=1 Tax=Aliarcobacter vitoriensis TaxID=2011099 RepID=A0A366MSM9_9BACT|nr:TonB-dependent siderophore receptor [Aliarcobacter vitoriensis]RBQ28853.1 TonB-dependent siderophore receptor [Aliarcobacter vitoriensis]